MVGMTCTTQWEDECFWIKKPQECKSLLISVDRLEDNIKSDNGKQKLQ
jgi:hypothetical protein